jgi:hypothetical protein
LMIDILVRCVFLNLDLFLIFLSFFETESSYVAQVDLPKTFGSSFLRFWSSWDYYTSLSSVGLFSYERKLLIVFLTENGFFFLIIIVLFVGKQLRMYLVLSF